MIGRVTIYVDSDIVTSFEGNVEDWQHRINFEIPRKPQTQLSLGDTPEPQLTPLETITLNLEALLNGNIMGYPYICLFYYNYDNPTQKQIELDVEIATGQMRNIL